MNKNMVLDLIFWILIAIAVASITMTIMMPLMPIYIKMVGGDVSLAGIVVSVFYYCGINFQTNFCIFY